MNINENYEEAESILLLNFNNKIDSAFSEVYSLYYKELYYYTFSIFKDTTEDSEDIIQDIFINILENKKLKFKSLIKIKSYIMISIKNRYKMYYRHQKAINNYLSENVDDKFFILQAVESEVVSLISEILNMLPEECARTLKLFLDGYNVKEIAEKLGKKESTIYNQKNSAISTLRTKLSKNQFMLLTILLN